MKNNVRTYREFHNLSQAQLAYKVGVSRQTINSLETEKYNPSIMLAFAISKVFGEKIEDVFIYEEENKNE